jgi:hypothetical protein
VVVVAVRNAESKIKTCSSFCLLTPDGTSARSCACICEGRFRNRCFLTGRRIRERLLSFFSAVEVKEREGGAALIAGAPAQSLTTVACRSKTAFQARLAIRSKAVATSANRKACGYRCATGGRLRGTPASIARVINRDCIPAGVLDALVLSAFTKKSWRLAISISLRR